MVPGCQLPQRLEVRRLAVGKGLHIGPAAPGAPPPSKQRGRGALWVWVGQGDSGLGLFLPLGLRRCPLRQAHLSNKRPPQNFLQECRISRIAPGACAGAVTTSSCVRGTAERSRLEWFQAGQHVVKPEHGFTLDKRRHAAIPSRAGVCILGVQFSQEKWRGGGGSCSACSDFSDLRSGFTRMTWISRLSTAR